MDTRQPLPRLWLMTDERQGDSLFDAVRRIPGGAGIVFRHHSLAPPARQALFRQIRQIADRRGLLLLLAGSSELAQAWGAAGSHGRDGGIGFRTAPAHDLNEIRAAEHAGAVLVFLSPVFRTRSHPDAEPLGQQRFAALAAQTRLPVIALGGMNAERFRDLDGAYGWAGIDAWSTG
jgi:thiamine-phosphate pyrophosphorylase